MMVNRNNTMNGQAHALSVSAISAIRSLSARADIVYARNLLTPNNLKGTVGEYFAEKCFLTTGLFENNGNWIPLNPRTGPQGIDHLFIKVSRNGRIQFMVGESKYGSSTLGYTKDGRQMSRTWNTSRIQKIGLNYQLLSKKTDFAIKSVPRVPPKVKFDVPVDGKIYSFWQDEKGNWYFSGNKEQLAAARHMAGKMASNLLNPCCKIRHRIFHIERVGNDLKITLFDVDPDKINDKTTINSLKASGKPLILRDVLKKNITDKELKKQISAILKKKLPNLSDRELEELTDDIAKRYKNGELLDNTRPVWKDITIQSLYSAGIASVVDVGMQLIMTGKVNIRRTILSSISAFLGTSAGQVFSIMLIKNPGIVQTTTRALGMGSFTFVRNALSGSAAGSLASIFVAYGGLMLGLYNTRTANEIAISGLCGTAAGMGTNMGIMYIAVHFGTTSTNVAIAGLSGAASQNAALAWIGGGSVASGGFGISGGTIILGGAAAAAAILVSFLVGSGFKVYNRSVDRKFFMEIYNRYEQSNVWTLASKRIFPSN